MPPGSARARAPAQRTVHRGVAPAARGRAAAGTRGPAQPCPSASRGSTAVTSTASRTSARVGCPISTSPGGAACSSREATLTASPVDEPLRRARHHLARHDADPPLEAELGQCIPHLGRRAHCAQRVVLVQRRHAEDGHHGIADELLDRAAVALDDLPHRFEVAGEQRAQPLGIDRLPERGRARRGRRTAPSPSCVLLRRRRLADERVPTLLAEPRALLVVVATARAGEHGTRVDRFPSGNNRGSRPAD